MYLNKFDIKKLVDISVAQMEGLPLKIMSTPKYKNRLYAEVAEAIDSIKWGAEQPNLVDFLTNAKRDSIKYWNCLPITKYTKISNQELLELLKIC